MTKRIIIACIFLAFATLISIFSAVYVTAATEKMLMKIDSFEDKILSDDEYDISELTDLWGKYKNTFGIILKHQDADVLDRYFLLLDSQDNEELLETIRELSAFLKVTAEGEKLKIENIF